MIQGFSQHKSSDGSSAKVFKPHPFSLFTASIAIIFVAEALVMLLIYFLDVHDLVYIGLVDAALLSLIVAPTLYFMLLKPMRETIIRLDNSELIQKQLEDIDRLKSDLIMVASHELYTPVTIIMGYTEMLLDDLNSDSRKEFLEIIHNNTRRLERIIDDLKIVDRFEKGEKLPVNILKHDLRTTVSSVCDIFQKRFPDIPIQLDIPDEPLFLAYDEVRIKQVIDNLLSNAFKYSKGLEDVIELKVVDQETQVLISVTDHGIGMTEDEVKQIYNKFFRAQNEKSIAGGLGLGMAIVKNIIDSHSGTIDVVSKKNIGTTVTFALNKHL